jgi:hypothetical protein
MPAVSKAQQKFMGMVHSTQKGDMDSPSPEVSKAANSMSKKDAKDFASTKHKGLPNHVEECDDSATANQYAQTKHDGQPDYMATLKELIRKALREKFIEEMTGSGAAGSFDTKYAFDKPGHEKEKAKKQASLTGYTAVNEEDDTTPNKGVIANTDAEDKKKDKELAKVSSMEFVKDLHENRWLDLKREVASPQQKVNKGISNINRQLAEVEKFLEWYGKLKMEGGVTNEHFWKRTNSNIYKIKERLIKLEQQIRKISE